MAGILPKTKQCSQDIYNNHFSLQIEEVVHERILTIITLCGLIISLIAETFSITIIVTIW